MSVFNQVHWWALLGIVLPLLVGLVTKEKTAGGIKGALFTLASVVLGVVVEGVQAEQGGHAFAWTVAIGTAVVAWVSGQVAHTAVWAPSGISTFLQRLGFSKPDADAIGSGWKSGEAEAVLAAEGVPIGPPPDLSTVAAAGTGPDATPAQ